MRPNPCSTDLTVQGDCGFDREPPRGQALPNIPGLIALFDITYLFLRRFIFEQYEDQIRRSSSTRALSTATVLMNSQSSVPAVASWILSNRLCVRRAG